MTYSKPRVERMLLVGQMASTQSVCEGPIYNGKWIDGKCEA